MTRTFILTVTLGCGLVCMAGANKHFLRAFGSFTFRDATNGVTVTASPEADKLGSVSISWPGYDSTVTDLPPGKYNITSSAPLKTNGWFVAAQDATDIWVFDGVSLTLHTFKGKVQTTDTISPSSVDESCPKEVRDALPEAFYGK